ncbi:MAG: PstA family ABC transporter permease [Novipirellula sp. JB048]
MSLDKPGNMKPQHRCVHARHRLDRMFVRFCQATAMLSVIMLAIMLTAVFYQGLPGFRWSFVSESPSATASEAGIGPALMGSMWVCGVCALFALPLGVSTAICLEEFKPRTRLLGWVHRFIQLNINNLAGVPSVVYGIIGLTAFAGMFGILGQSPQAAFEVGATYFDQYISEGERILLVPAADAVAPASELTTGLLALTSSGRWVEVNVIGARSPAVEATDVRAVTLRADAEAGRISKKQWYYFRLPLGRGVLAGGLTLMLVVLPIVIIASQEALRAVPDSLRAGSLGMGATPWQTVQNVTLPAAIPGIMTGSILAMSRAIGEAAPILILCGIVYIGAGPSNLMDDFSVMPLQIFNWAARPQAEFHHVAAQGIIVLLSLLLSFNAVAVWIRSRTQKPRV